MTKPTGRETAPGTARVNLRLLAPVLLGSYCLDFAIVTLSNLTDLLRSLHVLPADWPWISENLAFIATSTAKTGAPAGLSPLLLAASSSGNAWLPYVSRSRTARALDSAPRSPSGTPAGVRRLSPRPGPLTTVADGLGRDRRASMLAGIETAGERESEVLLGASRGSCRGRSRA
jgi:hypothetical protein